MKDPTQMDDVFQVLTDKGKEIVEKQKDPDIHGLQLEQVIKNPTYLRSVWIVLRMTDMKMQSFQPSS